MASPAPPNANDDTAEPRPLDRVRVLDLTNVIAGPFCTTMLADMGADVVKLERHRVGDTLREIGRYAGREAHQDYFNANNRSKRSIELDLKTTGELAVALDLAAAADILVENYAAGTTDRLGIGYEAVRRRNPRIVYCSISGFGQTGPYRDRPALDPIIQAVAGLMSVTGGPQDVPLMTGAPLADVIAGMFAAYAAVAALRRAERSGVGQFIDISMQDALLAAQGPRMGEVLQTGRSPARHGNENPMRVPADTFRTRDGHWLAVMCHDNSHWLPLCRAVGKPEWAQDPRFVSPRSRVAHREELAERFRRVLASATRAQWIERLRAERIPFAPVNDYAEAVADPQVVHRGLIHTLDHETAGRIRVVGPPWRTPGVPTRMTPPPLLGQHTRDVLAGWLGWDAARIDGFEAAGRPPAAALSAGSSDGR